MKANSCIKTFAFLAVIFVFVSAIAAQEVKPAEPPSAEAQRPAMKSMQGRHADFLHRLGLSEEQMQQIRKLHQERKPLMDTAQKRLRDATRALNEAIYADQANEADVQARINDLQSVRSEIERLRFMTEFSVRRVLTAEQLIRFRELRQQFENMRNEKSRDRFSREKPFDSPHHINDMKNPRNAPPSSPQDQK